MRIRNVTCVTGAALLGAALLAACGARSALVDERSASDGTGVSGNSGAAGASGSAGNGGSSSGSGSGGTTTTTTSTNITCTTDVDCDDAIACTQDLCSGGVCQHIGDDGACIDSFDCTIDVCGEGGCFHVGDDYYCDDGVLCTMDSCDPETGCKSFPSDAVCDDGIACTADSCDSATDTCEHSSCDSQCDDGVFCNGVERCDTVLGCTSGPLACTLGLGCESSSCAEATDFCMHSLPAGCVAPDVHLLATDSDGRLWDVAPYANPATKLIAGAGNSVHLDIAVLNGRWFALDGNLVELTPGTNKVINTLGIVPANSLGAGPDGNLYAASIDIYKVDPDTGATQVVGTLPRGHSSSGDIAFLGDRMFISTDSGCGGALVEFELQSGITTVLGGDGLGCVYGLAPGDNELFLLNCDGKVGAFDPATGQARIFTTTSIKAYGADRL